MESRSDPADEVFAFLSSLATPKTCLSSLLSDKDRKGMSSFFNFHYGLCNCAEISELLRPLSASPPTDFGKQFCHIPLCFLDEIMESVE